MNILDKILGWFSPEARRTYELSQLNAIWRRFNAGEDPEVTEKELDKHEDDWKHIDNAVKSLREFIKIKKRGNHSTRAQERDII